MAIPQTTREKATLFIGLFLLAIAVLLDPELEFE